MLYEYFLACYGISVPAIIHIIGINIMRTDNVQGFAPIEITINER